MLPPPVLAIHPQDAAALVILLVGAIALGLAAIGFSALRASGNRGLLFVSLAFLLFGAKGIFSAWALRSRAVAHEHLELILALVDLVVVGLLLVPFLPRLRKSA